MLSVSETRHNKAASDSMNSLTTPQEFTLVDDVKEINTDSVVNVFRKPSPIAPYDFLVQLLRSRGLDFQFINHKRFKREVSSKQLSDYNHAVNVVKSSNLSEIEALHLSGTTMSACNRFGESIMHAACRRCCKDVVEYIATHGGDVSQTDDYGRNSLHDACWREEPAFDIVMVLLLINKDLIRYCDSRGATPLHYVRQVHWVEWCAFLLRISDQFWPAATEVVEP